MAAVGHIGCPKITFDRIFCHFRSIGYFGCPKFTFDRISGHFRSIWNFFFRRPFWMSENYFRSFLAISDRYGTYYILTFFGKMAAGGYFGCLKITFDRISGFFRYIRNFFLKFLTKWPPAAILDGTTMSIIELVRYIWMSNACVKLDALLTKTYVPREYNYPIFC